MTGPVLTTFTAFSVDSGAKKKIAELTKIKESLAAKRVRDPVASPRITISGDSAKDAILRGITQLDKELNNHEVAIVETIGSVEGLIQRGMDKLNLLANQISSLCQSLEKKDVDRKAESARHEQAIFAKEQQLVTREAELAEKVKSLELQKHQQEQ